MGRKVDFLIIGFTGPIGSGCTTLANEISITKPSELLARTHFSTHISEEIKKISLTMREEKDREKLNSYNKQLIDNYKMRIYINEIKNFDDPVIKYISMSSLIMKLALDNLGTKEYKEWKDKNKGLLEIANDMEKFNDKWSTTLSLFRKDEKKELDEAELVDQMFFELDELKKNIKDKELRLYFENKITEFPLQSFGDNIRKNGNPFDSESVENSGACILLIPNEINKLVKFYRHRKNNGKASCFVIDAFRNAIEVEYFRKRYEQFYLISLYASYKTRHNRLKKQFADIGEEKFRELFSLLDDRDLGNHGGNEKLPFKQNVSRCSYLSDIAINNDEDKEGFSLTLFQKFLKYYALMISPGCVQPTKEETCMDLAYTLSLRSSCISRKVGAVVTDSGGFLIGMGWNDVAHSQIGCGFRTKGDLKEYENRYSLDLISSYVDEKDINDLKDIDSFCFKDILSKKYIQKQLNKKNYTEEEKQKISNDIKIKRLEFCRSLHAEENALLQIASRGGMGVNGGTIYTTTFPCELCAKKIYQSGIKIIYYTEPYPDSISENIFLKDGTDIPEVRQFEGVKSFSYFRLFRPHLDRKESQYIPDEYYNLF